MTTAQDAIATLQPSVAATAARAEGWRRLVAAALLVGAVAVAFGNALDNEFVYDDRLLIVDNRAVRAPAGDARALFFYRPLRTLSYRLDYAIGGLDPRVFHLSNLVYHALTTLLVRAVLEGAGASPWAAAGGALLFAVHPVQTDAVTYAAGRRDVLCGLFFAAGFLAYLRYRDGRRRGALAAALVCYLLALLAKEMAITLPFVCLLFDRFAAARARATPSIGDARGRTFAAHAEERASRRSRGYRVGALLAFATIGVTVAWWTYGRFVRRVLAVTPWYGGSPATNFATVARVWVHYLGLIVWPARLSADYSERAFPVSATPFEPRVLAALAVLASLALVVRWCWRRGDLAGFGAAWWAVTLLPVSHLVPYRELLAEHYLYVPMVGVAMAVAASIDALPSLRARRWATIVVCLVAATATARTIVRNRDWHDALTLWSATVATVPDCARARYNLGQAYFERVRLDDAEREWLAAAAITPHDLDTMIALAKLYYREGRLDDARRWVDVALARAPENGRAETLAGWVALDGGDAARALAFFEAALTHLRGVGAARARLGGDEAEGARVGRERATAALAAGPAKRAGGAGGAP